MATISAAGRTAPARKPSTPIRHRPTGMVSPTAGFAHGQASTVTPTATHPRGTSGGGTWSPRNVQVRNIDAASALNRAKGIGSITVPSAQLAKTTRKLTKAADVERARATATRTVPKAAKVAKIQAATVHRPAASTAKQPTHATAGGGGTKHKPKPQTSPITPPDQGGMGAPSASTDQGSGHGWLGAIEHYALIVAVLLLLVYAWRKGYIQRLGKSVARVGKGGKR